MIENDFELRSAQASFPDECSGQQSTPRQEVGLIEILTQLARRRWLIARITATAMLAGTGAAFLLPVRYTALTRLMPPQQAQSSTAMIMNQLAASGASSLAGIAGGGLSLKNPNDIYVGLLTSRPVADALIGRFGLEKVYGARDMTGARKKLAEYTAVATGQKRIYRRGGHGSGPPPRSGDGQCLYGRASRPKPEPGRDRGLRAAHLL